METWLARAMQVSYMEPDQIERLHKHEIKKGYIMRPADIQAMFGLLSIKERYALPDNDESMASHSARINSEIIQNGLKKTGEFYENSFDWMHSFDWNISKLGGCIMWNYAGSKKKGNILSRLSCLLL